MGSEFGGLPGKKNGFPEDIPDPYARMPRGQKVLVRTSTKTSTVLAKVCTQKVCADFLAPSEYPKVLKCAANHVCEQLILRERAAPDPLRHPLRCPLRGP